jgi:glutamine amidotransferase/cyclase
MATPTSTDTTNTDTTNTPTTKLKVSLLDYGAGNVRSVRNAIMANGYEIEDITCVQQIRDAACIIFPGVGSFGSAMSVLQEKGFVEPLREYLAGHDRPFLGICLGMQTLFESSDESDAITGAPIPGLGIIPGKVVKFDETQMSVPHIGWNGRILHQDSPLLKYVGAEEDAYYVHSYYAPMTEENKQWVLTSTTYEKQAFVSAIQRGSVVATQFHPEKSGVTGLNVLKGFLEVCIYLSLRCLALSCVVLYCTRLYVVSRWLA